MEVVSILCSFAYVFETKKVRATSLFVLSSNATSNRVKHKHYINVNASLRQFSPRNCCKSIGKQTVYSHTHFIEFIYFLTKEMYLRFWIFMQSFKRFDSDKTTCTRRQSRLLNRDNADSANYGWVFQYTQLYMIAEKNSNGFVPLTGSPGWMMSKWKLMLHDSYQGMSANAKPGCVNTLFLLSSICCCLAHTTFHV